MSGAAAARAWSVTGFRPGDEPAILELFRIGFGKERELGFWNWRFRDNPLGGPLASLARRNDDGRVVGTYLVIPAQLNLGGSPVRLAQVVDLVVHPDYRRQGMFEAMAKHSYESLGALGYRLQLAFPNPDAMSYPGFTRTLGWTEVGRLRQHTLALSPERMLRKLLRFEPAVRAAAVAYRGARAAALERSWRTEPSAAGAVTLSGAPPAGYAAFWDACRASQPPSLWKDEAWLRWRYDADPAQRFEYAAIGEPGRPRAVAVTAEIDGSLVLCELIADRADTAAARALVVELCRLAIRRKLRSVRFYGFDDALLPVALRGFTAATREENVLVGHAVAGADVAAALADGARWSIAFGDADFV